MCLLYDSEGYMTFYSPLKTHIHIAFEIHCFNHTESIQILKMFLSSTALQTSIIRVLPQALWWPTMRYQGLGGAGRGGEQKGSTEVEYPPKSHGQITLSLNLGKY